jgi:hypothetical protein
MDNSDLISWSKELVRFHNQFVRESRMPERRFNAPFDC